MDNFSVIVRYCRSFFEKRLKEFNLTFGEQIILIFLSKHKDVNQDAIAKRYMIDKGMVAKTLNKLEEKGFILREQNPDNKRENIISLTEKSADVLYNINLVIEEWNTVLYEEMNQDEIDSIKKLLGKMAENLANHMD